jgi:hypothetical protein
MAISKNDCTLITQDRFGIDLILKEYPGRIDSSQIQKTRVNQRVIYKFSGLNQETVESFLLRYPPFTNLIVDSPISLKILQF